VGHGRYYKTMTKIIVKTGNDHISRNFTKKKPVAAICELIWNALDADASEVVVNIRRNEMNGFGEIRIADNGHGLRLDEALKSFSELGNSWKKASPFTRSGRRRLHGRKGQGRFLAYSLGSSVTWFSTTNENGTPKSIAIRGSNENYNEFDLQETESAGRDIGTTVSVLEVADRASELFTAAAQQEFVTTFALYLYEYKEVRVLFDGREILPKDAILAVTTYTIHSTENELSNKESAKLEIVEWKTRCDPVLHLCDLQKARLHEVAMPKLSGYHYTAYLHAEVFDELSEQNSMLVAELTPEANEIIKRAKDTVRVHFSEKEKEKASNIIEQWKSEDIYPYAGEPSGLLERVERNLFDVMAVTVNDYHPTFSETKKDSKHLTLVLLKQAIQGSPADIRRIFEEVLKLPADKREEFARLLDQTSLSSIVTISKLITDRLFFLSGLKIVLFEDGVKQHTLERKHLQKLLESNPWVFGEQYSLSAADETLTSVLDAHLGLLRGTQKAKKSAEVRRADGSKGVVDFMLTRSIRHPDAISLTHLVVEIKRPTVKLSRENLNQIRDYADAIAKDERFDKKRTNWQFWLVGNIVDEYTHSESNQADRPAGLYYKDAAFNIEIWVRPWSELVHLCEARLEFVKKELGTISFNDLGLEFLNRVHRDIIPEEIRDL